MQKDYWLQKWHNGDIKFNQSQRHGSLPDYFGSLEPSQVFVPLCGKSIDMVWLLKHGHNVIGVELSDLACRDFFTENDLAYSERIFTTQNGSRFLVFESEHLALWCGDFFELPLEVLQSVNAIYDRAALIALPEPIRERYAAYLCDFVNRYANEVAYLLVTIEYDQSRSDGPPFSVPQDEVHRLFDNDFRFDFEEVFSANILSDNPKFAGIGSLERVYVLTAKSYESASG